MTQQHNRRTCLCGPDSGQLNATSSGFTLTELLITLAVTVIIATIAVPNYQAFAARNQVSAEVLRLKTALALAKNTAVTRRTTITVCPSHDRQVCLEDWKAPLMIVEGTLQGGTRSEDEPVLKVIEPGKVAGVAFRNGYRFIRFPRNGWPRGYNGTFLVCGEGGEGAQVIMSNMGRVRSKGTEDCQH